MNAETIAIIIAVVGFSSIIIIMILEHRRRKKEIKDIIARVKARGCRRRPIRYG